MSDDPKNRLSPEGKQILAEMVESMHELEKTQVKIYHPGSFNSVEDYMNRNRTRNKKWGTKLYDNLRGRGGDDVLRAIVKNDVDPTRVGTLTQFPRMKKK